MKVLLSLLGTVAITSSSVVFTSSNVVVGHKQEQVRLNQNNDQIDWKTLTEETTKYFDNFKQQQLFNSVSSNEMIDMFNYAQEKANIYIKQFQDQNFDLKQIMVTLSKEFPEFDKNYNNYLNSNNLIEEESNNILDTISSFSSSTMSLAVLKKKVQELRIYKTTFVTTSAAAAVASACFWAAAGWFGLSIPWATTTAVISALTGGIAAGISLALVTYDQKLSDLERAGTAIAATYTLGHIFVKALKPLLIGAATTATATSWAWPAVLAIIPVTSAILSWVNLFN